MKAIVFIPLAQGCVAVVDHDDFEKVRGHKYYAKKRQRRIYAARATVNSNGRKTTVFLHQDILPNSLNVDHRDGDGLNNCRGNLRAATHSQNMRGFQHKRQGTSSQFRGVSWDRPLKKWRAMILVGKNRLWLGSFKKEIDAARAYDAAAIRHFGEFASPNFSAK